MAPSLYGLFQIGPLRVAIPASLVREVVSGPVEITPLPQAPWHVLGAFAHRQQPIPVFDLATLLQPTQTPYPLRPVAFAVILAHDGHCFAVQVDAIHGLVSAAKGTLAESPLFRPGTEGLYRHLFTPPDGGAVHIVLDLDALLRVEQLRGAALAAQALNRRSATRHTRTFLSFRLGAAAFALPASEVVRLCDRPHRLDSELVHPVVRGFHRIQSMDTTILSLHRVLGLAQSIETPRLLVMRSQEDTLGWEITAPLGFHEVDTAQLAPLPASTLAPAGVAIGSFTTAEGEAIVVLDAAALCTQPDVVSLPASRERHEAGRREDDNTAEPIRQYMILRAGGGTLAIDIAQLCHVTELPVTETPAGGRAHVLGSLTYQQKTVPVLELAPLLGRSPSTEHRERPVLVVQGREGLLGLGVESIDFLQRAQPQRLPSVSARTHGCAPAFRAVVRANAHGREVSAVVLDVPGLLEGARVQLAELTA